MATSLHKCTQECPPAHREHLNHMTDGRWHDGCRFCLRRREKGGSGLEGEVMLCSAELACVTPESAGIVAREAERPGDPCHTARQEGLRVILAYLDKRYPYDVAGWAFENGHASDAEAANTIARL
jgi:hypothetical protein